MRTAKAFLVNLVSALALLSTTDASASNDQSDATKLKERDYPYYLDCKIDQAYKWRDGRLMETPYLYEMGMSFQQRSDHTGILFLGMKAPGSLTHYKILQDLTDESDLIATSGAELESTTLRIHKQETGHALSFINLNTESIASGHCLYRDVDTGEKITSPENIKGIK